ncbi:hypothetical protein SNEBB_001983 [Seison nebaliae]|nr:hypothetical protein SNEBB_001983 [Seison nebaliae]
MKYEVCAFSGFRIHPGHGRTYVKADGKVFHYINSKCERSAKLKKSPREVSWTVFYRRGHRKGIIQEIVRRRATKVKKPLRDFTGMKREIILARRSEPQHVRDEQKKNAIKAVRAKKKQDFQHKTTRAKGKVHDVQAKNRPMKKR